MIYLVTNQRELFKNDAYKVISPEESLHILEKCRRLQFDTETDGRDAHVNKLLCIQFGSKKYDFQMVVDCSTVDVSIYKHILETRLIVGQNLKFDEQFMFNHHIIPRNVYDTMIVEQVLFLGYPFGVVGISDELIPVYTKVMDEIKEEYSDWNKFKTEVKQSILYSKNREVADFIYHYSGVSLKALCWRYLGIDIDKTVRGQIIWRGLDTEVILYAAKDVELLEDIMLKQLLECRKKNCVNAARLECQFVPVISYLEWSGIKLDVNKWRAKMDSDLNALHEAETQLNEFVLNNPNLKEFTHIDEIGDLFTGWDTTPKCIINWSSSQQVTKVAKKLGFDTTVQDADGEDKDSVMEKYMKSQKGINDEFLRLYYGKGDPEDEDYFMGYSGAAKVVTSFGQGHLNAINPRTGRIHTVYKQLGCDTGRMSSGNSQNNEDLAKLKGLPIKPSTKQKKEGLGCSYPNMQQLPHDAVTRACFVSEKGNMWVSCDYSAIESRLGADIYQEHSMIEEFLHGSGDMHSLVAKMIFKELKDVPVKEIKKRFPHLRSKAKPVEFSQQFGGSPYAIQNAMGCPIEEAEEYANNYAKGFPGVAEFKKLAAKFVRAKGSIILCPLTGHKTYWWDHQVWVKRQESFTSEFWDNYRMYHKGTGDRVAKMVSIHSKAVSKWERKGLNSVTQGEGVVILKESQIRVFNWVVDNGYFGTILLCNLTHDEANWEYPKEVEEFPSILKGFMEDTAAKYCKSLPIPAEAEIDTCWRH